MSVSSFGVGAGGVGGVGGAGAAGTVTVAVPDFPSLVAVIVTVPAATAVTTPDVVTAAILLSPDDHATSRPVSVFPLASCVTAVSVSDDPIESCDDAGVTTTDATGTGAGALTVTCAVPTFPSLVAVIVAVPDAIAVTTPDALTVAVCGALDAQTTPRPASAFPLASYATAFSVSEAPTESCDVVGATTTDATGTGAGALTVICALPTLPSLVAVMVAVPAAFAVTTPDALTVAVCGALEAQTRLRPASAFPFASYVMAVSVIVPPTVSVPDVGATATDATAMGVTVTVALALFPPVVAEMVAVPAATAVIPPFASTATVCGALDVHATARPPSGEPFASNVIALSVAVAPIPRFTLAGATVTDATGTAVIDSVAMAE